MFTRVVKMEFEAEHVSVFLINFEKIKKRIRSFPGCCHLELWQDKNEETMFFTYSKWEKQEHLEAYRNSAFFKNVWATTKPLFRSKAQAWSVDSLSQL